MRSKVACVALFLLFVLVLVAVQWSTEEESSSSDIPLDRPEQHTNVETLYEARRTGLEESADLLQLFFHDAPLDSIQKEVRRLGVPLDKVNVGRDAGRIFGFVHDFTDAELLEIAMFTHRVDVIEWMFDETDEPSKLLRTYTLHNAVAVDCLECVRILLEHGADPISKRSDGGASALDIARMPEMNRSSYIALFDEHIDSRDGTESP